MPPGEKGVSIFGASFRADIDFSKALTEARNLDTAIKSIGASIKAMVRDSVGQLDSLAVALASVSAAAAGAGVAGVGARAGAGAAAAAAAASVGVRGASPSQGTIFGGVPMPGGTVYLPGRGSIEFPRAARPIATPMTLPSAPMPSGMVYVPGYGSTYTPESAAGRSQQWSGGPVAGRTYTSADGRVWRIGPNGTYHQVGGPGYTPPPPGGGYTPPPGGGYAPPPPGGGGGFTPPPPPGGGYALPPQGGPSYGGQGMYGGRWVGFSDLFPGPNLGGMWESTWGGVKHASGQYRRVLGGVRGIFNYQNLMRGAAGLYMAQNIGNVVGYAAQSTIGQALDLEERQTLLQNALMSDKLGISRQLAGSESRRLIYSDYFAGMPVTAQEMGLSRPELAEQFRQLAPIIRITAQTQDEFQAGLQTGALARALLVARDPVQGTKGAMVALSELYSGGPDRFRSLALRFELPRNRLLEIEQEMGGANAADPGKVLIQMLSEMGFGPDYLTRRAGTTAGQVDRMGALYQNFRVELYSDSLDKVRTNLTQLNDAFESFLDSNAGEEVISLVDRIFGSITGFGTGLVSQLLGTSLNAVVDSSDPIRTARHISEYMQTRNGQYVDSAGAILTAGQAFVDAAKLITDKQFTWAARAPQSNTFASLSMQSALMASGLMGGMAGTNWLLGGAGAGVVKAFAGGASAGFGALGKALMAGPAIPLAAAAAIGVTAATAMQSGNIARNWREFAAMSPELAAQAGYDANMSGSELFWRRVGNAGSHVLDVITPRIKGSQFPEWMRPGPDPAWTMQEAMRKGGIATILRNRAALMMTEGASESDIRSDLALTVDEFYRANPNVPYNNTEVFQAVQYAMQPVMQGDLTMSGEALLGVALRRSVQTGRAALVGEDGAVLSSNAVVDVESAARIGDIWDSVVAAQGGEEQGIEYLKGILAALGVIEGNTKKSAEALTATSYLRPSQVGDVFTGFVQDPDLRFIRGTSIPRPSTASPSPAAPSVDDSKAATTAGGNFWGGVITEPYGAARNNSYGSHTGLDVVLSDPNIKALAGGSVEYLYTDADYARNADLFGGGGTSIFGNSAIFRDAYGLATITYSHLSDDTKAQYGADPRGVRAGQAFAVQGNTGKVYSSSGGDGTHVHIGAYRDGQRVDPMSLDGLYSGFNTVQPPTDTGSTVSAPLTIDVGGVKVEAAPGQSAEEIAQATVDAILDGPDLKRNLFQAISDLIVRELAAPISARNAQYAARSGAR